MFIQTRNWRSRASRRTANSMGPRRMEWVLPWRKALNCLSKLTEYFQHVQTNIGTVYVPLQLMQTWNLIIARSTKLRFVCEHELIIITCCTSQKMMKEHQEENRYHFSFIKCIRIPRDKKCTRTQRFIFYTQWRGEVGWGQVARTLVYPVRIVRKTCFYWKKKENVGSNKQPQIFALHETIQLGVLKILPTPASCYQNLNSSNSNKWSRVPVGARTPHIIFGL